jgi:uncharacterized LabA/DUF88 family protein
MKRIGLFLDVANLEADFRKYGATIDYCGLRRYLAAGRKVMIAICYIPIDPGRPNGRRRLIYWLVRHGFQVSARIGSWKDDGNYKCDFDAEMASDMTEFAIEQKPDAMVIGVGDGDFIPVYSKLKTRHIEIEVAATVDNVAGDVPMVASRFFDLRKALGEGDREGRSIARRLKPRRRQAIH